MNSPLREIIIIVVVALATLFTRIFPFVLFGKHQETPAIIRYLGTILPSTIMAILIIYCLRHINIFITETYLYQILGVLCVTLLHLWKKNILLSIAGGTFVYMFLVQLF